MCIDRTGKQHSFFLGNGSASEGLSRKPLPCDLVLPVGLLAPPPVILS